MASDARTVYQERLAIRQQGAARLARAERQIGTWRLLVFALALLTAWLAFAIGVVPRLALALPAGLFVALVLRHGRVIGDRRIADRAVAHYQRGLARLDDDWAGHGEPGARFADAAHPYSGDLDLFGPASLFELLCTARTRAGEDTLAAWLCAPAEVAEIRARQAAVEELRPRVELREAVAVLGADVGAGIDVETLTAWAGAPAPSRRWWRALAAGVVCCTAAAALAWELGWLGPLPCAIALLAQAAIGAALRPHVRDVVQAVERPARDLHLLATLLARIEAEGFSAPRLVALRAALDTGGVPPSRRIAQLGRLVELLDARRNQFFAPLAPLLLWGTQLALAIDAWRATCGAAVPGWQAAVGEFEALAALSGYAYEHAGDPFPALEEHGPLFEAEALGHPLLPARRCVPNDVRLAGDCAVLVVSGSNMSGKSTLLRSVGVAAVLAQAGAPVRARRLRLSPLAVGSSMRVHDSLHDGTSRFYAEIQRLRQLVDLSRGPRPLLFLLDEILHGTNSHDRRIGAEAVVRGLVAQGAIGLVTTHDLSLAHIADALAPRAQNVHFEDHLENGRMVFDYRMRPGVVRKSNALELMRAVGLAV